MPYPNTHTSRLRQERDKMALRMHCSCILLLFHLKSCCYRSQTMSAPPPSSINTWTCEILDTHSQPHTHLTSSWFISHQIIQIILQKQKENTHTNNQRSETDRIANNNEKKSWRDSRRTHKKTTKQSKKWDKTTKMRTVTHGTRKQKPTTTAAHRGAAAALIATKWPYRNQFGKMFERMLNKNSTR